jgi:hypothetical protein
LCSDPAGVVRQVCRRLGWKGSVDVQPEPVPERRFPELEASARWRVERELRDLHLALVAQAL